MPLKQLDTENADRNLTSQVTVLTHTPDASNPTLCIGLVQLGDGTKNLDGSGGDFELSVSVGGQTVQPDPQTITFSAAGRAAVWTTPFPVPANASVLLKVKSPNAGDSDVDVTAYLYEITYALPVYPAGQDGGLALHDDVTYYALTAGEIADAVWDETLADHDAVGSTGEALAVAAAIDPPTVEEIADRVWDEGQAEHISVGSTGESQAIAASQATIAAGIAPPTVGEIADAVWDEPQAGHTTTLTFGTYLDAPVSEAGGGSAPTVGEIADAVWDEPQAGHTTTLTFGSYVDAPVSEAGGGSAPTAGEIADAVWDEPQAGHTTTLTFGSYVDAPVSEAGGGSAPTAGEIADAVWDEPQAGHTTTLTFGTYLDAPVSEAGGGSAPTAGEIADAVWDEALADHDTAGSTGEALAGAYGLDFPTAEEIAVEVWESDDRTLTIPAAGTNAAVDAGQLILRRGDTYVGTITDLSNLVGYQEVWLTVKASYDDDDENALIQITASGGLMILAADVAADPTLGSITIDEVTGTATINLSADVTTAIERTPDWTRTPKVYDLQVLTAGDTVVTIAIGTLTVLPDVTRTFAYYGV